MNTFSKDGLFVKGLGESQIEDLLNAGLVTADPESFYSLSSAWKRFKANPLKNESEPGYVAIKTLLDQDGWGPKKWDNLMDAIDASRETTLQKFLYSLNIPLLGNDLSKKLDRYFHSNVEEFKAFVQEVHLATAEPNGRMKMVAELMKIDGIGEEKALNVVIWAEEVSAYREAYEDFIALINELEFPAPKEESGDDSLKGYIFVITGSVNIYKNRDEFKASVEARGGKVAGSVSAKTSFLVNNDVTSTSGKNQKAKELGIEIISEDEFISRFGR